MDLPLIFQLLVIGLVNGSIYVLLGLGLTLLFGVSRIVNMAHGEIFAGGGYITYVVATALGLSPIVGLGVSIVIGFAVGWLANAQLISRFRRRLRTEAPLEFFLILTMGLSIFLQNTYVAVWGADNLRVPATITGSIAVVEGLSISNQRMLVLGLTLALVAALFLFLNRTRTGTAIRAASQDRDSAQAVGINIGRLDSVVFGISVLLGAAAGSLTTAVIFLHPQVGTTWLVGGFVAVIAGGLGNPIGTLIAGYALGIAEGLAIAIFPTQFKTMIGLLIMIGVLILRPQGILGRKSALRDA